MEKTIIRRATIDDALFLAQIILISGRAHVERGIWEAILGGPEQEVISFLEQLSITDPPHLFHYSCFLIAEVGYQPVAGLGGYDPNIKGYDKLRKAIEKVQLRRGYTSEDPETAKRAQKVLSCLPENIDGAWIIDSVATLPDYRRNGISEKLLKTIMKNGHDQGYTKTQVNIYIGNMPAKAAYKKLGYSIDEEKRCPGFMEEIGSPGMARMTRDL